ncbi:MAG: hypothetical protein PF541_03605 [Prolixibacteraceae bacterium]|jgi:hypothetical protein|nr:hypothetical protein [Prolixibacteraceae bacterium]
MLGILLLMLLGYSCELESEINFDIGNTTSYIVINGAISNSDGVKATINKTVAVNNPDSDNTISKPTVWLCVNSKDYKKIQAVSESRYELSADSISFNKTDLYSIKVEAEGFETATTVQQQLIEKVAIDTAYITADSTRLCYTIYDNLTESNYYAFSIYYYYNDTISAYIDNTYPLPFNVFSDSDHENGGVVTRYYDLPYADFDSICIELSTVSLDYYQYIKSYLDYELTYGDYYYESVYPVISTVENGFGFFTAFERNKYVYKNNK